MFAANIISSAEQQDDRADDGLDIPAFLKISARRRKQAWLKFDARHPSKSTPAFSREMTETEHLYRASIERDKAAKRAADEVRFQAMRAKAAAEKAERQAVRQAVEHRNREQHRAVAGGHGAGVTCAQRGT